jgi:hypothetical protein
MKSTFFLRNGNQTLHILHYNLSCFQICKPFAQYVPHLFSLPNFFSAVIFCFVELEFLTYRLEPGRLNVCL